MKKQDLIRHLTDHGCVMLRDKGKHTIYVNPESGLTTAIPRKREINDFLARKICRDLGIPEVR
jgi:predicted RNA binding protein YcfA (HicA-like mRNA interferase family)